MNAWSPQRDKSGFFLSSGPSPTSIAIESDRIEECIDYYRANGLTRISISSATGFKGDDIDFLSNFREVRGVLIPSAKNLDISGLLHLKHLEYLVLADCNQPIDLSQFQSLFEFHGEWQKKLVITSACHMLTVLSLRKYKPSTKDLSSLAALPSLENLSVVNSSLASIRGVGRFPKLKRLELAYLIKLDSISDIEELRDSQLKTFECKNCKKIRDHSSVQSVPSLEVVRFNSCGEIKSLNFLGNMPNIKDFRFVNTKILDGNLSPLLQLESIAFTNNKKYTHTVDQVNQLLQEKGGEGRAIASKNRGQKKVSGTFF